MNFSLLLRIHHIPNDIHTQPEQLQDITHRSKEQNPDITPRVCVQAIHSPLLKS